MVFSEIAITVRSFLLFLLLISTAIAQVSTDTSSIVVTDTTPDLNTIIRELTNPNADGDAQQSATIRFPAGHFYLTEPVTYRGSSGYSLQIIGAGSYATRLHYIGDKDWAIRFLGANRSSIESLEIINEATKPIKQIIWFDATNTAKDNPSRPNNGCWMRDVCIGTMPHSLTKDGTALLLGRTLLPTPQVSIFQGERLDITGQDFGSAIEIRGGGNVKGVHLQSITATHWDRVLNWEPGSGTTVINDLQAGQIHDCVVRQIGGGNLVGTSWNMEGCGAMIWQAGGTPQMSATVTSFEWYGPGKDVLALRTHGATLLSGGLFQNWGKVPWIEQTYPLKTSKEPCSLHLDRVWFADGDEGRLPVQDGSGNKLLHPESYYKDKPVSFTAENCFIGGKKIR